MEQSQYVLYPQKFRNSKQQLIDISTNIWSLHYSFHFHIEIERPINISAAILSKKNPNDSQITASKS